MEITHLQSATQILESGGVRLLTDPWLTEGEYYGSWYHYPPFPLGAIDELSYDFVYVSHIHPDHLSEETFRRLPERKPVLIFDFASKFMKAKIERLGFEVIECQHGESFDLSDDFSITIYAAGNCNPELCGRFLGCPSLEIAYENTQIDTVAVFKTQDKTVINLNDCPFELAQEVITKHQLNETAVDLLLLGYAGAGPYPQCFNFSSDAERETAAQEKERKFLTQAQKFIDLIKPKSFAPFAGTYILGSRLASLNEYRGVPAVSQATAFLEEAASTASLGIALEQFDVLSLEDGNITKSQVTPEITLSEYVADISQRPLVYDTDSWDDGELEGLATLASERFTRKAQEIHLQSMTAVVVQSDRVSFCFRPGIEPQTLAVDEKIEGPYLRLTLNHNLLHRLLRGPKYAHWNNAEIGSHIRWEWNPNVFNRGLQHCLYFLHA